ncbi:MAG TPA: NUDIX hydrolase [Candidatus Ruthenibacterium merdigallinarum]|nr:NUDIX hydrolase [Candidatus Ruthenibacterium merdigallinarum]
MSEYILGLRALVGHRPLLQVGAGVIVEDAQGRVLLQKRRDNHCWGYAGGSVELDEKVEDAARRELYEETGLRAQSLELFGVFSGRELHYVYPNGDEVSNIDIVYICRAYTGALQCQEEEVECLRFFDADALPQPLSPPIAPVLRRWAQSRR